MTVYTDMQQFISDLEGSTVFKTWCKQHGTDCATWEAYRAALMANQGTPPGPPAMSTPFGKSLIDAGVMAIDAGLVVPPPKPPPVPPPPPGTVLFDGRFSQMASMDSYQTDAAHANLGPTPLGYFNTTQVWNDPTHALWDCVCYGHGLGHNYQLVADAHYGKISVCTVRIGDTNQWGGNTGLNINGAAEVSKRRTLHTDGWAWFAQGVRIDAWNGDPRDIFFAELGSYGYQTSASSQVALGLNGDSGSLKYCMNSNAGYGYNTSGWALGSVNYSTPILPVTFGQWEEFAIGVKASTGADGEVQVYHRPLGGSWSGSPIFDFHGATEFYGVASGNTFPQNIEGQGIIDKHVGLYYGNHSQTVNQQTVKHTGMAVCSDLPTAQAMFP